MSERIIGLSIAARPHSRWPDARIGAQGCAGTQAGCHHGRVGLAAPRTAWAIPTCGMWPIINLTATPFQRPLDEQRQADLRRSRRAYGRRVRGHAAAARCSRNQRYEDEIKTNNGHGPLGRSTATTTMRRGLTLVGRRAEGRPVPRSHGARQRARAKMRAVELHRVREAHGLRHVIGASRALTAVDVPFNYNNGIEINQAPGYVIVRIEMVHEARVIPVDGRAQLDTAISSGWAIARALRRQHAGRRDPNFNGVSG